jgi:hypothetical protein
VTFQQTTYGRAGWRSITMWEWYFSPFLRVRYEGNQPQQWLSRWRGRPTNGAHESPWEEHGGDLTTCGGGSRRLFFFEWKGSRRLGKPKLALMSTA